jgi:DNA polymerase I-like protein with 3'-5' exonuclease and polymerase domains
MSALDDVELTLITTPDDVANFQRWLGERRPLNGVAYDTETTGLDTTTDKVRLMQFGDAKHGWAMDRDDWLGLARWVFNTYEGSFYMHNAGYDVPITQNSCGISIPRHRVHDTMVMSAINESHMSKGLKQQATRHVDSGAAGLQADLKNTAWTFETVPIDYAPYWQYGALDPVLTYMLAEHHEPIVQAEAPRAYEIEMAVLWVVEKMKQYGTHIDRRYAEEHLKKFSDYCDSIEKWCQDEYGVKPGSNQDIIGILAEQGFQFDKPTKSGAISLDAEVLDGIDHPLAQAVLNRRKAQKMASTYLRFYVQRADHDDLIHPTFNTLGARTSRMSCSEPNLQNLPRLGTSKFGDVVRNCISTRYGTPWDSAQDYLTNATDPDRGSLLFCDYSQIEMRVLAHFANENAMIEAFQSDQDFFVTLARQIFHDDTIDKKDKRRQVTKNAGYATIYSAGVRKFSQTAGIPEAQGREFMARWNTLYPNVRKFQDQVLNIAMQRLHEEGIGYARSPLTNRKYVAEHNKEYALVNYMIQGAAAELNKLKLVELDAAGIGEWMFATVHDEVLLDVPGEHVREVVATLESIMNDDKLLRVPIEAEASFGERWGQKVSW